MKFLSNIDGNADMVDGKHAVDFVQLATEGTAIQNLNNFINLHKYAGINQDTLYRPPGFVDFGKVINIGFASNVFIQIVYDRQGQIFIRGYAFWENPVWRDWQKIATDKQSDWIVGTLQNGWNGAGLYRKNGLGEMEIALNITAAGTVTDFTTILTLPTGYRPSANSPILAYNISTGESTSGIVVLSTGEVKIRIPASTKITTGNSVSVHSFY